MKTCLGITHTSESGSWGLHIPLAGCINAIPWEYTDPVEDPTVEKGKGSLIHHASDLRRQGVCFGMLITSVSLLLFQKLIKVIGVWRLDRIVILNFRFVCVKGSSYWMEPVNVNSHLLLFPKKLWFLHAWDEVRHNERRQDIRWFSSQRLKGSTKCFSTPA